MNPVILADNRFSDGTPTATDTASGYSILHIRDLKTYTAWRANTAGTKYLVVDCGSAKSADVLGIVAHNLGTAEAAISVDSSPDNSYWTERLAAFTPSSDKATLKTFTKASARYWRVKIVSASVIPQVAVCLLGERLTFPYPPEAPFSPVLESMEADVAISKTGVLLGTTVRFKPVRIDISWKYLPRAWVEGNLHPFWSGYASNLAPFLFAWDLDAYPLDVRFVRLEEGFSFSPSVSLLGYYDNVRLQLTGVKE